MKFQGKQIIEFFQSIIDFFKFIWHNNFERSSNNKKKVLKKYFSKEGYAELQESLDKHLDKGQNVEAEKKKKKSSKKLSNSTKNNKRVRNNQL